MAKSVRLVRLDGPNPRLAPADPYSAELIEALRLDKEYRADLKEDRSRGKLNLYWAGIGLLVHNMDEGNLEKWPSSRRYSDAMLMALGHSHRQWYINGSYIEKPDSIALDNMEEPEFNDYFEKCRALTVEMFGYDPWDTWLEEAERQKQARINRRTE